MSFVEFIVKNNVVFTKTTTKRQIDSNNETRNADFRPLLSFVEFIVENNVIFTKTTTTMDTLLGSIPACANIKN